MKGSVLLYSTWNYSFVLGSTTPIELWSQCHSVSNWVMIPFLMSSNYFMLITFDVIPFCSVSFLFV